MSPRPARTVSVWVDRDPRSVYRYVSDPRHLPAWAPGFAKSVHSEGDDWLVQTGVETLRIEFVPENDLGVLDHHVTGGHGLDAVNPMRVIANGDGAEVLFTLFREPETTDEEFARDLSLVQSDLRTLKRVLEGGAI
jgi:uncharacterized protein YndB with AHSA1/START domain